MKAHVQKRALDQLADEYGSERARAPKRGGPKITVTIGDATVDDLTEDGAIDLGTADPMELELPEDDEEG